MITLDFNTMKEERAQNASRVDQARESEQIALDALKSNIEECKSKAKALEAEMADGWFDMCHKIYDEILRQAEGRIRDEEVNSKSRPDGNSQNPWTSIGSWRTKPPMHICRILRVLWANWRFTITICANMIWRNKNWRRQSVSTASWVTNPLKHICPISPICWVLWLITI